MFRHMGIDGGTRRGASLPPCTPPPCMAAVVASSFAPAVSKLTQHIQTGSEEQERREPMEVKCTVDFGDIEAKLKELGPKLARKALRKAVKNVGDMWVAEAKSRVPVDQGDLKDSIAAVVRTKAYQDHGEAKVSVGPCYGVKDTQRQEGDGSQQPAVYGMFVELGTKKTHAEPYLRPAFDATAEKAVQLLADSLRDDLDDVVRS